MLPRKAHRFPAKHWNHDLQCLFKLFEPVGERAELKAEGVVFELEPTGTDPQGRPARRNVIKGGYRLGQKGGMPVGVTGHQRREANCLRVLGEC